MRKKQIKIEEANPLPSASRFLPHGHAAEVVAESQLTMVQAKHEKDVDRKKKKMRLLLYDQ